MSCRMLSAGLMLWIMGASSILRGLITGWVGETGSFVIQALAFVFCMATLPDLLRWYLARVAGLPPMARSHPRWLRFHQRTVNELFVDRPPSRWIGAYGKALDIGMRLLEIVAVFCGMVSIVLHGLVGKKLLTFYYDYTPAGAFLSSKAISPDFLAKAPSNAEIIAIYVNNVVLFLMLICLSVLMLRLIKYPNTNLDKITALGRAKLKWHALATVYIPVAYLGLIFSIDIPSGAAAAVLYVFLGWLSLIVWWISAHACAMAALFVFTEGPPRASLSVDPT